MTSTRRAPLHILSCDGARPLAESVAAQLHVPIVRSRETWFACGEGKMEILENVRGSDLYIFQAPVAPGDPRSLYDRTMMLLHAIEAAALSDAQYVTVVVPYFPCARQDKRKGRSREGISAGLLARCMQAAGARRVISLEIHNEAISGMFDPAVCRLENVSIYQELCPWLTRERLQGSIVAAPDVGGLERARHYAEHLSQGLAVISKVRDYATPNRIIRSTLIGDVAGRDVLLVDDIIDTGGSVAAAVTELREGGARNITVSCAHPVLSDPAWERLTTLYDRSVAEGWTFRVAGTNAVHHPNPPHWYRSFDIAPLFARVIESINSRRSVTSAERPTE
jgi:ribose-phosphate pyrophosphokinase